MPRPPAAALPAPPAAARLRTLPTASILGCEIHVAIGLRARLLGLAWLDRADAGPGLLIPRCASVHTFGMRFALDLVFLDAAGRPLGVRLAVRPHRVAAVRGAAAVLELPARSGDFASRSPGEGGEFSRSLP